MANQLSLVCVKNDTAISFVNSSFMKNAMYLAPGRLWMQTRLVLQDPYLQKSGSRRDVVALVHEITSVMNTQGGIFLSMYEIVFMRVVHADRFRVTRKPVVSGGAHTPRPAGRAQPFLV